MSGPIVLGYDGSEGAKAALAEALALAKALGTSITLAFGYEAPAFYAGEAGRPARRHRGDRHHDPRGGPGRGQGHRLLRRGPRRDRGRSAGRRRSSPWPSATTPA